MAFDGENKKIRATFLLREGRGQNGHSEAFPSE